MQKSWIAFAFVAPLALLAAGCGGGGAAGGATSSAVTGKVVSVDGQTYDLGGIEVTCANDGTVVTTAADGSFSVDVPSGETLHLRFHDRSAAGTAPALPNCSELGDTRTAASPRTSGSDPAELATTGTPTLIASNGGKPNPSYREG